MSAGKNEKGKLKINAEGKKIEFGNMDNGLEFMEADLYSWLIMSSYPPVINKSKKKRSKKNNSINKSIKQKNEKNQ